MRSRTRSPSTRGLSSTASTCRVSPASSTGWKPSGAAWLRSTERWLERERARLAHGYQVALEALAVYAEAAGDRLGALGWWERLAKHDPLSSRIALRLMQVMVATGDRVGALRYGELHARLLREELDTRPDTGERVFVEELREQVRLLG